MDIINIKHKKDLITMDLRTKQIRYLNDFKERTISNCEVV